MAFAFAGQWGPEPVVDRFGNAVYSATFRVLTTAGAEATVYTDRTKATTVTQPLDVDGEGNATFYAAPGRYTVELTAGGSVTEFPVGVVPDAEDVEPAGDVATQFAATVKLTGAQTVAGAKTFSTDPTLADGSSAMSLTEGEVAYRRGVSVAEYGAVGDGVTDDTAAIRAALAEGKNTYFPPGVYLVGDPVTNAALSIGSNVTVFGAGVGSTTIKLKNGGDAHILHMTGAANVTIRDLTVDGNRLNQVVGTHGIRSGGVDGLWIHNVRVTGVKSYGIGLQAGTQRNVFFSSVRVDDTGLDGIDVKNPNSDNTALFMSDVTVDGHGKESTQKAGIDLRGPWLLSNVSVLNVGASQSGIRFRYGAAATPGGLGAHYSRVVGHRVTTTDATAIPIDIEPGVRGVWIADETVPHASRYDGVWYVDGVNGNDGNDGRAAASAWKTWARAREAIPEIVDHSITIRIVGALSETVELRGVTVRDGGLLVRGDTDIAANHAVSVLHVYSCAGNNAAGIKFDRLRVSGALEVGSCSGVQLDNIEPRNPAAIGVSVQSSMLWIRGCAFGTDVVQDCVVASFMSTVNTDACSGNGTRYGLQALRGATIGKRGGQPTGTTANENVAEGGVIR